MYNNFMDVAKVVTDLTKKFPNKSIFKNDELNTTEIVCEVDPSTEHPTYSKAVAIIDKSIPHIHYKSTEKYTVTKGVLKLFIGNTQVELNEGDSYVILPNNVHWGEGNETWIECYSKPGWTFEDQIPAKKRDVAVVIFYDNNGNIGVQRRGAYSKAGEKFGLWGGGKEEGESAKEAIEREMTEELSYIPDKLTYWKYFTFIFDIDGIYKNWIINHDVFLAPITAKLINAKVIEGEGIEIMALDKALNESDFLFIKPLLFDLKVYLTNKNSSNC